MEKLPQMRPGRSRQEERSEATTYVEVDAGRPH